MRLAPFIFACVLGLSGCSATPADPALSPLLDLIERRLAVADVVALHKWDNTQPVQATDREQALIAAVRNAAPGHGLDPARAAAFFHDQIEANKLVQYARLSQWQLAAAAPALPRHDLQRVIRPQLDALQTDLLHQLASFNQTHSRQCARKLALALEQRQGDALHRAGMIRATGQLCD
nr:chorismate mutase [uncultured Pseudomonas sp.]